MNIIFNNLLKYLYYIYINYGEKEDCVNIDS